MGPKANVNKAEDAIRILLVDDHPIVRQGISLIVAQEPDMVVCGEAETVADALAASPSISRTWPWST